MQRRSRFVAAFLATVSIAPLGLTAYGCSPAEPEPKPVTAKVYSSLADCKAGEADDASCDTAFAQSKASHASSSPTFSKKAECEQQFGTGNCETRQSASGGGDVFGPALMGFMLGSALANSGGGYDRSYNDRRDRDRRMGPAATPIYYGTNGAVYSGNRQIARTTAPRAGQSYRAGAPVTRPSTISVTPSRTGGFASVGTTSRGGFGATSAGRSAGG